MSASIITVGEQQYGGVQEPFLLDLHTSPSTNSLGMHEGCSKTVVVLCSKPSTTDHDASSRRACISLRNQVE